MIKNERQFRVTQMQKRRLEEALAVARAHTAPDDLLKAHMNALESQLAAFRRQIRRYETVRSRRSGSAPVHARLDRKVLRAVPRLGTMLIEARIAAKLTHKELAARAGKHEQAIQRYEKTDYVGASLGTLAAIAKAVTSAR